MATTLGDSRHDDTVINTQTISTSREASSVTAALLPQHPPDPPHAEAVDEEERRPPGADSKERAAECSVSIPATRCPPAAANSAAAAGVRRDEVDPASCYPQRDSAWAAALAACIALLIIHELISPLFALQWPGAVASADGVGATSTESDKAGKQHGRWQRIVHVAKHDSAFMCESIGTASAISCAGTATLLLAALASMSVYSSLGAGMAAALASGLVAWTAALALCFLYWCVPWVHADGACHGCM
ncbi:unnamed protein product [Closterium sp. Naga37s-1]|nr:unnamed protein product [Closterium sp. Naga37s-1]